MSRYLTRSILLFAVMATLVASATAQDDKYVDFSQPVMKASAVLDALSKQSGVYLDADPIVGDVPILVSVKSVKLTDLLDRIAHAVGGAIKPEGGGYRLVNDQDQRRQEAATEQGWTEQAFAKAVAKETSDAQYLGRWDTKTVNDLVAAEKERREKMKQSLRTAASGNGQTLTTVYDSSMTTQSPATAAAYDALSQIPASVLASIGPGDRIVFSTSPNRMQRRFPFNVAPIANNFYANYNMVAQHASELQDDPNIVYAGGLSAGAPIRRLTETHMILSRPYRSTTVNLTLKFVDDQGLYVGQGSVSVTPDYGQTAPSTSDEGTEIKLSELSRQMAVLMAQEIQSPTQDNQVFRISTRGNSNGAVAVMSLGNSGLPKIIPPDLMTVFVNPDKYDPTSLYVSEVYMQTAAAEGKNIVATFPDTIVKSMARLLVKGRTTTKTILGSSSDLGMNVSTDGSWMVATPTWSNNARETRFDRKKAANLFRNVNSRGFATLEELADYSLSIVTGTPDRSLDMVFLSLINQDVFQQFDNYAAMNLDLLRLYGSIPDRAKNQAGTEAHWAYNTVSGSAKTYIDRAVYNRSYDGFLSFAGAPAKQSFVVRTIEQKIRQNNGNNQDGIPANSIYTEPTEALPNGIPGDTDISLKRSFTDAVFASQTGVRGGKFLTAKELGMDRGLAKQGNLPMPNYDKFLLGRVADVSLSISLPQNSGPSATFTDGTLLNNPRPLSYDELPAAFLQEVEQMSGRIGNAGGFRGGGGG